MFSPLDVSATVTLKTDNLKGLRLEDVHLRVKNASELLRGDLGPVVHAGAVRLPLSDHRALVVDVGQKS